MPLASGILEVNVIAKRLLLASSEIRSLRLKPRVVPVNVKPHRLRDAHCENKILFAIPCLRARPDNPIPNLSSASNSRLAGSKRADAKEWVGRKTVISGDHVGIQPHAQQPYLLIGRRSRSTSEGLRHSFVFPKMASTIPSLCHPRTSSAYFSKASGTSHSAAPCA
jgi:hypothetical protein